MRAPFSLFALAAPLALPLALSACGDPAPAYVDQAWIRLSPNKDMPAAGYFVAHGGDSGAQLRGVITDYALKVEMHESMTKDGMTTMERIDSVDIPAKGKVAFAPGGKHLMLWGVNDTAISRGKMQLTFLMANGDRLLVDAVIQKPGVAAGNTGEHQQH
ncbi:copper chaperone PCu(A)C [Sphingobium sp. BYY-5]|uniref:copper chaperone PCu(A)C n=1 Tax=Sphingobium sp. BYY-5 TaxID=2926400 RepID=UPI001FA6FF87|nr:copper chaperone PCu(A)C [Sphingobium sp. BYY-5]MCI4590187.1 copper chaperone PCu(A)C [Sphingobium sp. BYY-5]